MMQDTSCGFLVTGCGLKRSVNTENKKILKLCALCVFA